jgi:putative phosphoesterase
VPDLIGLLADAHGNAAAFERAVGLLAAQGAQRLYFLGDAVGYIPGTGVLEAIERLGERVSCIRGNHEEMLLRGGIDAGRDAVYQLAAVRARMSPRMLEAIAGWPALRRETIEGHSVLFVHGSPADPTFGYVYPDTELAAFDVHDDVVFMANTHRPFVRAHAGRLFVNVGSCGLPRDDGRYGCAALFDPARGQVRLLRFDIQADSAPLLAAHPGVHPSVHELFQRRAAVLEGEEPC